MEMSAPHGGLGGDCVSQDERWRWSEGLVADGWERSGPALSAVGNAEPVSRSAGPGFQKEGKRATPPLQAT